MPKKKQPSTEQRSKLDELAAAVRTLPADRREAFERDVLKAHRKAERGPDARGRPPIHGETLSVGVLVKVTPAMRDDMKRGAKRLGFSTLSEYVRELHRRFMEGDA
jgi:hypothetical protein